MHTEPEHDDTRIESETPEPYYPVMPSPTLLERGRRLIGSLNRHK